VNSVSLLNDAMLCIFRCALYFATEKDNENEKLCWLYWKDKEYNV